MSRIPNTERHMQITKKSVDLKMLANLAEVLMEQSLGKSEKTTAAAPASGKLGLHQKKEGLMLNHG